MFLFRRFPQSWTQPPALHCNRDPLRREQKTLPLRRLRLFQAPRNRPLRRPCSLLERDRHQRLRQVRGHRLDHLRCRASSPQSQRPRASRSHSLNPLPLSRQLTTQLPPPRRKPVCKSILLSFLKSRLRKSQLPHSQISTPPGNRLSIRSSGSRRLALWVLPPHRHPHKQQSLLRALSTRYSLHNRLHLSLQLQTQPLRPLPLFFKTPKSSSPTRGNNWSSKSPRACHSRTPLPKRHLSALLPPPSPEMEKQGARIQITRRRMQRPRSPPGKPKSPPSQILQHIPTHRVPQPKSPRPPIQPPQRKLPGSSRRLSSSPCTHRPMLPRNRPARAQGQRNPFLEDPRRR